MRRAISCQAESLWGFSQGLEHSAGLLLGFREEVQSLVLSQLRFG